jgi:hypothetical protein
MAYAGQNVSSRFVVRIFVGEVLKGATASDETMLGWFLRTS